ncbi:MAG TPA: PKD domain-containing protein [Burkholderiaceae bacterium]|nr:PKD domain-containing protein [Burkholderiaceae bacterium]
MTRSDPISGRARTAPHRAVPSLAFAALALAAATASAHSGHATPEPPTSRAAPHAPVALPEAPRLNFPFARARGDQAVAALGAHLPAVAAAHGLSAERLLEHLRTDRSMWIDRTGRVFYSEESPAPPQRAVAPSGGTVGAVGTPFPLEQTFMLNSRPGAARTIFLDFDGHTVTGSAWNSQYGLSTINAAPFDLDGVPGSFSAAERERIQAIWQRVAEDYAPFDVNVTTQDPGAAALNRSGSADLAFGIRVLVTRDFTRTTASPCGCGGFAYLSIFDMVNNESHAPAWVFFDQLGGGDEKYVADAITHETGHTLGLSHDGTSTTGYYTGHGSGETGWAPIMGVGYYQNLVQWSRGDYAGANNTQDDVATIAARGAPLRADDHGNSMASATSLRGTLVDGRSVLSAAGLVGTAADVDVFRFEAGAGAAVFTVSPAPRGPNLDVGFDVLNASGTVIASAAPSATLGASLSVTLPSAGQYFLVVGGVGNGDPRTTGYSDYGSLGEYAVSATVQPPTGAVPIAVARASTVSGTAPLAVSFDGSGSSDPDGRVVGWSWTLGNGATATGPTASTTYTAAGTYVATLTVVDDAGQASSASVQISVSNPVAAAPSVSVGGISMSRRSNGGGTVALAQVAVRDSSGRPMPNVAVSGGWSGSVSGSASGTTGADGTVTLQSPRAKRSGSATFTVGGLSGSNVAYDPARNATTSASISW